MDTPIKVIFRYKNLNRRIQYLAYIFVGELSMHLKTVFDKISDLTYIDSLLQITRQELKNLEDFYGAAWYNKLFITDHLMSEIEKLKQAPIIMNKLREKFGHEWCNTHLDSMSVEPKEPYYSYAAFIKRGRKSDTQRVSSLRDVNFVIEDTNTMNASEISTSISGMNSLINSPTAYSQQTHIVDYEDNDTEINFDEEIETENTDPGLDDVEIETLDTPEDKNLVKTTKLIEEALRDMHNITEGDDVTIPFDTRDDKAIHDAETKNIIRRVFITNQYIYTDDTIRTVRAKICYSIANNPRFPPYILPSFQYLWSKYKYKNVDQYVMIGQKWVVRNDLLKINTIPHTNIRVYEELEEKLELLRDSIKRYGSRIRGEDNSHNILFDYIKFITNNEIYMIDVYNELGQGYKPHIDTKNNVISTLLRVYFPRIGYEEIGKIFNLLQTNSNTVSPGMLTTYETIKNDIKIESEVMKDVEREKRGSLYKGVVKENYVTQSVIHITLKILGDTKIDLYRVFSAFEVNEDYPFIQYQKVNGQTIYKYNEKAIQKYRKTDEEQLIKWFESAPYGISFKICIKSKERFMAINLAETGKIEYKTQWKEDDKATVEDTNETYKYIKDLVRQINKDKNKTQLVVPDDEEFRYAFINTIQRFELPDDFTIDHNDLSEFSRYFFPYVALVIEPRKRQSKTQDQIATRSKFGTYLRYKRVSKYENESRIEQRVLYFLRNYECDTNTLVMEISKQFNITYTKAVKEVDRVKQKYPNLRKSRKILKRVENMPKYKPPGIGIDIQGKYRDKYKIRISGARSKEQLDDIVTFTRVLLSLYIETYYEKVPERQAFRERLKKLTSIAKRRSRVEDFIGAKSETRIVKQMTQNDKERIGFKPKKGQNQWTRSCQNSGDDKRRRPQQYTSLEELEKDNYKKVSENTYEREIKIKENNKTKKLTLKTVSLGKNIHYGCGPEKNKEHMYIGFLTRSNNPYGHCMPCCFKKNPLDSKNKRRREYFEKCINSPDNTKTEESIIGDKSYILQDTNKIQRGRLGFLSKQLDNFLNKRLNKTKKIKHHYMAETNGYFLKLGVEQGSNPFLDCISIIFETTPNKLIKKLISKLSDELVFTALNSGDIKTKFITTKKFASFLKEKKDINFDTIGHFVSIPGVIVKSGLIIIVFEKVVRVIKSDIESVKVKEDFLPVCLNHEDEFSIKDPTRQVILLIKEDKNYYPIVLARKTNKEIKGITMTKFFRYDEKEENNVVKHIVSYYSVNCLAGLFELTENFGYTAKETVKLLSLINTKDTKPVGQIIDIRNKCKYIVLANGIILSVKPSGSIVDIQILSSIDNNKLSYKETMSRLNSMANKQTILDTKPLGIYYDTINDNNNKLLLAKSIYTNSFIVPIKQEYISVKDLEKDNLSYKHRPIYDTIDKQIEERGHMTDKTRQVPSIGKYKYETEAYQLFRLELSEFLCLQENKKTKNELISLVTGKDKDREKKIMHIIARLVGNEIGSIFLKGRKQDTVITNQISTFIHILNETPDITNYRVNNIRDTCPVSKTKKDCTNNVHCYHADGVCRLAITRDLAIIFTNKVVEEFCEGEFKALEILKISPYFVSDVADPNSFPSREGQVVIKSGNHNIKKLLEDIFGTGGAPVIGKRKALIQERHQQLNIENPPRNMRTFMSQQLPWDNFSVTKAYVNGLYWLKQKFYPYETRNLGYSSTIQIELVNQLRGIIVDWISDTKNEDQLKAILVKQKRKGTATTIISEITENTPTLHTAIIELYTLSKVSDIPIRVVTGDDNKPRYKFKDGFTKVNIEPKTAINIKVGLIGETLNSIEVLYYK